MRKNLDGKKISVIGAGVSGCALAVLAAAHGAKVLVSDSASIKDDRKKTLEENGIAYEEKGNTQAAVEVDLLVVSSGVSPNSPILLKAAEKNLPVVGELDFVSPYLDATIIAVTGSNGKTTTTSMTSYLLEKLGKNVCAAGNIGEPIAHCADKKYDFIVAEFSSFQLYWAKQFRCDAAIVTNLAPDHIDWHGSYENYVASKSNILSCLKKDGFAICQKRDVDALKINEKNIAKVCLLDWNNKDVAICLNEETGKAYLFAGEEPKSLFRFEDTRLLGKHNAENTAMSLAAIMLATGESVSADILAGYSAPGHRCAFVDKINEVTFIDDSKGTNVAATVAAMTSLPQRKVIILGGQGKGEEYTPLSLAVKEYASFAVIIGTEKEKIAASLTENGCNDFAFADNMENAVSLAYSKAAKGETVLLSPACTSWDMYSNYKERGIDFCNCVAKLKTRVLNA